jgi:ATP-dependent RNA helicase RhlE
MTPFSDLGLSTELFPLFSRVLEARGCSVPTAVQAACVGPILQGRDVLATAPTGSGKTLAFALPLVQLAVRPERVAAAGDAGGSAPAKRGPLSLVLVPTRDLAAQVGETLLALARAMPRSVRVSVVYGGVSIRPQMQHLRPGSDIVVATPGRLLDLISHNALSLNNVAHLVLDEADRMLDLGFGEELARIVALLPASRQNLFFSATFSAAAQVLAGKLLRDPLHVAPPDAEALLPAITQRAIEVDTGRRCQLLAALFKQEGWSRALVFVATKHAAETVADKLRKRGLQAEPFHGELSQGKRTQVLRDFKASMVQVVVATDLAGRGIDIEALPVVVNYDLPRAPADYTHRIGRTARAGSTGMALSFVSAATAAHFALIEKRQGIDVTRERIAGFEPQEGLPPNPLDPAATGGIKGRRPSKKDRLRALNTAQ